MGKYSDYKKHSDIMPILDSKNNVSYKDYLNIFFQVSGSMYEALLISFMREMLESHKGE